MTNDPEVQQKIAELEATLKLPLPKSARDAIARELAALKAQAVSVTQDITGERAVAVNGNNDKSPIITGNDNTIIQSGEDTYYANGDVIINPTPEQQALKNYLCTIRGTCRTLQMGQIDQGEAGYNNPMHLERVYVSLNITRQVEMSEDEIAEQENRRLRLFMEGEKPMRPLTAVEAMNAPHPARLILLGAPGSGKSTLVNHLALCLIEAYLDDPSKSAQWLNRLPAWSHGPLIPIRIILRDFAEFDGIQKASKGTAAVFLNYLTRLLGTHEQAKPFIETALNDGKAILLFDGLDEVVGEPTLSRVVETIQDVATTYSKAPILVTCRILDYEANPKRQIAGFTRETLAELSDKQIAAFVQAWYAEIDRTNRKMLGNANGLQQAIRTRPELEQLARSPLLLTMMAIVHAGKGALPHSRALLYYECIDLLLRRWRRKPDEPDILNKLNIANFTEQQLVFLMARLGFVAHDKEKPSESEEKTERAADLSGAEVRAELQKAFMPYARKENPDRMEQRCDEMVSTMLHAIATRNGLLLKRSNEQGEQYAFPHRSFQEFLAGYYLHHQGEKSFLDGCLEYTWKIGWQEVMRLMVGYQVHKGDVEKPFLLAKELQDRSPIERTLAGEILVQIGQEQAEQRLPRLNPAQVWDRTKEQLVQIVTTGMAPEQGAALRVRAGVALGMLGDPRPGVCTLPPAMVWIEGGTFVIGNPKGKEKDSAKISSYGGFFAKAKNARISLSQQHYQKKYDEEINSQPVTIATFEIGRYPITNAQYELFINDGGYDIDAPWWDKAGRAWLGKEKVKEPRWWNHERLGKTKPNHPVVWITLYETMAYCRWLTQKLNDRYIYRLPTEAEWEYAARRDTGRIYPWGNEEPDGERANYGGNHNGTTAVGVFPKGATPDGIYDMAGNVWEWTGSIYKRYPYDPNDGRENLSNPEIRMLVLRGCGWYYQSVYLRASYRFNDSPVNHNNNIGFRLARCLP